jgi:hypothetical protein
MTGRQEYDRTKDRQRILGKYMIDYWVLAAHARPCAARTRLFELIATPNGALRAPPAHRTYAASYSTPKNIYNLSNLGRPHQGLFSFHWTT